MRAARGTARLLTTALALLLWLTAPSPAAQSVRLKVSLTPERLGAGTTLSFALQISSSNGQVPPPLRNLDLLYPINLGLITSGLGLSTCSREELEAKAAC